MNFWSVFFAIVLFFWVVAGSYWYTCKYCQLCEAEVQGIENKRVSESKQEDAKPQPEDEPKEDKSAGNDEPVVKTTPFQVNKAIYFGEMSDQVLPDTAMEAYQNDLKKYLGENPNKSLLLIGHTDNVGLPELNLIFGKTRAERVKDLLIQKGIQAQQIFTDSKGLTEPAADNTTPEGRSKNRRVEIQLKQ